MITSLYVSGYHLCHLR